MDAAKEVKNDIGSFLSDLAKHLEESKKTVKVGSEIEFPITVNKINYRVDHPIRMESTGYKAGQMVAVRSCKEQHGDKTRLGILVGFISLEPFVSLKHPEGKPQEGELMISSHSTNPVIFIPELNESVLGAESWWGAIKDEKELRQITNDDIQNVWYVKALKQISEAKKAREEKNG